MTPEVVQFSVDYFTGRYVPFVCLISCSDAAWDIEFAKAASARSVAVSKSTCSNNNSTYKNKEHCFQQYYTYIGVLLDANCAHFDEIFWHASKNRWFDFKHPWLIVNDVDKQHAFNTSSKQQTEKFEAILQSLRTYNISVDADIVIVSKIGDRYALTDVFNFGKVQGGDIITTELGVWRMRGNNEHIVQTLNSCKYLRRYNFQQLGIRIISVATSEKFDPKMLLDVNPVKGVVTITRTSAIIINEVAEVHNFRLIHSRAHKWLGTYEPNATRVVATALYYEEQDISSIFRYLKTLFGRVTLIHPALTTLETRYYYRIPTTGPGKYENQFARPLSVGTWYCLLAVSAAFTLILVFTSRLEGRPTSVQFAFFSVAASVCQQFFEDDAYDMALRRISSARKLSMFVMGTAGVLLYNYYTSSVVSWLLNGPPPSINSLQELVDSPLELIFEDVGYTRSWLTVPGYYFNTRNAKAEDMIRYRLKTKKRTVPLFVPLEQGIAMVKAGGYAYLTEPFNADNLISASFDKSELCELGSVTSIDKVKIYPGVQRNSPYKEFFTWSLTRFLEKGIISCIQRRTSPHPVSCEGSSPRALALGGAAPAFILLAAAYMLATAIMLLERLVFKLEKRKTKKKQIKI